MSLPAGPSAWRRASWPAWAPAAVVLLAPALLACSDAVQPALGGLSIGRPGAAFQVPVMENETSPFGFPEAAWEAGRGGVVVLRIHIDHRGTVDSVYVKSGSGSAALDSAARRDAGRLRFRPARQGEDPVDVWATLPVRYPAPEQPEEDR